MVTGRKINGNGCQSDTAGCKEWLAKEEREGSRGLYLRDHIANLFCKLTG